MPAESMEDERVLRLETENDALRKKLHLESARGAQLMNELAGAKAKERMMAERISELQKDINARTSVLKEEIEKVGKLVREKDEFIRNISHELKTPLAVIALNLPLAERMAAKGKKREFLELMEMMRRNAMRLRDSIEDILELSRLGAATGYKREKVDVRSMVSYAEHMYAPIARRKGLKFETRVIPAYVLGDPGLLPYALSNLVSNAIKFTDRGKISIAVSAAGGEVSISVSDTGRGIAKAHMRRIFDKFFKADPSAPGSGLGLTIVKEIIEGQGGRIKVRSRHGAGSTFTIVLRRAK